MENPGLAAVLRTRIKFCGITNHDDAAGAAACGVDAVGFNFYQKSTRYIAPEKARDVAAGLPAFVTTVGLFVNESEAEVEGILKVLPLDLLQFHGDETPAFCESFGRPYIKALRATNRQDITQAALAFESARGVLLDTATNGQFGGTGKTFDWTMVPDLSKPLILAGGLDASNVGEAIIRLRPYSVDVSGGVEQSGGIKDLAKMKAFVEAVRTADDQIMSADRP